MSSCTFGDSSKIDRYYGDGLKIFCELGPNCVCQPPAGHPVPVPDNGQCCMLILTEDHPRTSLARRHHRHSQGGRPRRPRMRQEALHTPATHALQPKPLPRIERMTYCARSGWNGRPGKIVGTYSQFDPKHTLVTSGPYVYQPY